MIKFVFMIQHILKLYMPLDKIIAQVLQPILETHEISVNLMSMCKQVGSTDCGLYAIATATAIAFGIDPTTIIFSQDEMRSHLGLCLERSRLEPFPVRKKRRVGSCVSKIIVIYICPVCTKQTMAV